MAFSRTTVLGFACVACAVGACGDDAASPDAGSDATATDAPIDGGGPPSPEPAALPVFTPCPTGWREVAAVDADHPATCEPFPESGHADCVSGEAHFPGEAGCRPVLMPCDAEGWPPMLPSDGSVVHVRAGAMGGDGSRALPYGTVLDAFGSTSDGDTVAIAPGRYDGVTVVRRSLALIGCGDVTLFNTGMPPVVLVVSAPDVRLEGIRIADTRDGLNMIGRTTLRRVVIEDCVISLAVLNGSVDGEDVVIRRTNTALSAAGASAIDLRRVEVVDSSASVFETAVGPLDVRDLVVKRAGIDFMGATLLAVSPDASAHVERASFVDVATTRAFAVNDSRIELVDTVLEGAAPPVAIEDGGVVGFTGSEVVVSRTRLTRTTFGGFAAGDPGSTLTASDVWIRDIAGGRAGDGGAGVEVGLGATASLARVLMERTRATALIATMAGAEAQLVDVTVRDVQPDMLGTFGRALQVQHGAVLDAERLAVTGVREVAVVSAEGASVALRDAIVARTIDRDCVPDCGGAGIGLGIYAAAGRASRFVIEDSELAGVQIGLEGELDLSDGRVSGSPIGINVQVPDYDLTRLQSRVFFLDNDVNLDASMLPTPDAVAP